MCSQLARTFGLKIAIDVFFFSLYFQNTADCQIKGFIDAKLRTRFNRDYADFRQYNNWLEHPPIEIHHDHESHNRESHHRMDADEHENTSSNDSWPWYVGRDDDEDDDDDDDDDEYEFGDYDENDRYEDDDESNNDSWHGDSSDSASNHDGANDANNPESNAANTVNIVADDDQAATTSGSVIIADDPADAVAATTTTVSNSTAGGYEKRFVGQRLHGAQPRDICLPPDIDLERYVKNDFQTSATILGTSVFVLNKMLNDMLEFSKLPLNGEGVPIIGEQDRICLICRESLVSVVVKCGHTFCLRCVQNIKRTSPYSVECAFCKEYSKFNLCSWIY